MPRQIDPKLAVDAHAILGEGPLWHPREHKLYWVDIDGKAIHVHDPAGEPDRVIPVGRLVGAIAFRRSGGLIVAGEGGLFEFDSQSGRQTLIADPEAGVPDMRFNDGKVDPHGRFWIGTYNMQRKPGMASLYRLDADRSLRKMFWRRHELKWPGLEPRSADVLPHRHPDA